MGVLGQAWRRFFKIPMAVVERSLPHPSIDLFAPQISQKMVEHLKVLFLPF